MLILVQCCAPGYSLQLHVVHMGTTIVDLQRKIEKYPPSVYRLTMLRGMKLCLKHCYNWSVHLPERNYSHFHGLNYSRDKDISWSIHETTPSKLQCITSILFNAKKSGSQ